MVSFKFQVSSFKFQVSSFKFQVSSFELLLREVRKETSTVDGETGNLHVPLEMF